MCVCMQSASAVGTRLLIVSRVHALGVGGQHAAAKDAHRQRILQQWRWWGRLAGSDYCKFCSPRVAHGSGLVEVSGSKQQASRHAWQQACLEAL